MKRVIDGKLYNTETSARIAWAESRNAYRSDFGYWFERLYRTPGGRWFIHGEGGPMTRWAEPCGSNGRVGGSGIDVLSEAEALAWCERHGIDADIIAAHFQVEEG